MRSLNPLRHALPTRRLRDALRGASDPLETFFAAWRFRPDAALTQLLDYLAALGPGRPTRASASACRRPDFLLGLLRYDSGVVGSLEVGAHLPDPAGASPELVVECFCRESVHHCWPGNQTVLVEGLRPVARDWAPNPAEDMVAVFVDAFLGWPVPEGLVRDDTAALALVEALRGAGAPPLA